MTIGLSFVFVIHAIRFLLCCSTLFFWLLLLVLLAHRFYTVANALDLRVRFSHDLSSMHCRLLALKLKSLYYSNICSISRSPLNRSRLHTVVFISSLLQADAKVLLFYTGRVMQSTENEMCKFEKKEIEYGKRAAARWHSAMKKLQAAACLCTNTSIIHCGHPLSSHLY